VRARAPAQSVTLGGLMPPEGAAMVRLHFTIDLDLDVEAPTDLVSVLARRLP